MIYRFSISKNGGPSFPIEPVYTDGHARSWQREADQAFLRAKIDNGFIFRPGNGYEEINGGDYEDSWTLLIEQSTALGWREYFTGSFSKPDCEIDQDKKRITAKLQPIDKYTTLLKNWSAEYDVAKLGLSPVAFSFFDSPLIQVYLNGYRGLFNLTPDRGWIADYGRNLTGNSDFESYRFSEEQHTVFIPGEVSDSVPYDIFGTYTYIPPVDGQGSNSYQYVQQGGSGAVIRVASSGIPLLELRINGQLLFRRINTTSNNRALVARGILPFSGPASAISDTPLFYLIDLTYRSRILVRTDTFLGSPATPIDESDIYANGVSYTHAAPYLLSGIGLYDNNTATKTNYGKFTTESPFFASNYFAKPALADYPLTGIGNGYASAWFTWSASQLEEIAALKTRRTVNDGYFLKDVINALSIEASEDQTGHTSSELLYGNADPVTGEPGITYLVVPKSNILTRTYTKPATVAPLKLSEIAEMLLTMRNAKWHVDESGFLVFEHIAYYDNGLSYPPAVSIGFDIRNSIEAKTRQAWEYKSNLFTYRKADVPQRITLKAMDTESPLFEEATAQIQSVYANPDQSDDRRASLFSFDIDHAAAFSGSYAETGFFLLACRTETYEERGETVTALQVVSGAIDESGTAQNHLLSRQFCLQNYYQAAAAARTMTVNGREVVATSLMRTMEQNIVISFLSGANFNKLIRATVGNGKVDSATENMTTGRTEITLLHEPK